MVQGINALRRRFNKTIPEAVQKAARDALEENARELVAEMKRLVPVKSGNLRDSIDWTWGDAPEGSVILAQSSRSADSDTRITVYAGARGNNLYDQGWYVRFVEFGTVNASPHPFFFPSYRKLKRKMKGRATRKINQAIKRL